MIKKSFLFILFTFLIDYSISSGFVQEQNCSAPLAAHLFDSIGFKIKKISFRNNQNSNCIIKKYPQEYEKEHLINPSINNRRLILSSLMLISFNYAAYQPFKHAWWEEERTYFHLYRGWRQSKGYWDFGWNDTLYGHIDKLGHYFSARLLSEQIYYISRWIGFNENSSKLIGPILSSLLMLQIEIYDGHFKEWGFSIADFTANELGAFAPLIAEKISFLKNFQLKFSYHPSNLPKQEATFIKDYAGMTFWFSCNVHSLLPVTIKKYYPPWLNFALGYSVSKPTRGKIELYLAPDINWMKVPIGNIQTMTFIKKTLNYFHFPCFSLKLLPDEKFYSIYF